MTLGLRGVAIPVLAAVSLAACDDGIEVDVLAEATCLGAVAAELPEPASLRHDRSLAYDENGRAMMRLDFAHADNSGRLVLGMALCSVNPADGALWILSIDGRPVWIDGRHLDGERLRDS